MDGTDGTDGTDGSVDAAGNGESLAQRICRRVLTTARSIDPKASITSVAQLNEDNDATLVRVAAGDGVNPSSLAALLRSAWPLAQVAVVENYAEGTHEAQVRAIEGGAAQAGESARVGTGLVRLDGHAELGPPIGERGDLWRARRDSHDLVATPLSSRLASLPVLENPREIYRRLRSIATTRNLQAKVRAQDL